MSAAPGARAGVFAPWVEAALRVRILVVEWGHAEESWVHWAIPVAAGAAVPGKTRPFDPGRRAGMPGDPPIGAQRPPFVLDAGGAHAVATQLLALWQPRLHRHAGLGLVSGLGEDAASFRRRCLSPLAALLRQGVMAGEEGAATVARLAGDIETRPLDAGTMEVLVARVGVAWYPAGTSPQDASGELLIGGAVRATR